MEMKQWESRPSCDVTVMGNIERGVSCPPPPPGSSRHPIPSSHPVIPSHPITSSHPTHSYCAVKPTAAPSCSSAAPLSVAAEGSGGVMGVAPCPHNVPMVPMGPVSPVPPGTHLLLHLGAVGQRVLAAVVDGDVAGWGGTQGAGRGDADTSHHPHPGAPPVPERWEQMQQESGWMRIMELQLPREQLSLRGAIDRPPVPQDTVPPAPSGIDGDVPGHLHGVSISMEPELKPSASCNGDCGAHPGKATTAKPPW